MFKTITKAVVLTAVAGGLQLTLAVPANAYPTPPSDGRRCGFTSVTDPTIESGEVQTGQINGGPAVATIPGATISMRCTIQVGSANSTHNGADSCSVSSAPTIQVTAVPPTLCSYLSPDGQPVYMCSEVTVNGVTYYWDSSIPNPPFPTNGQWTTSSAAACDEAISQEIFPGPLGPVLEELDKLVFCPALVALAPTLNQTGVVQIDSTGDTYINGEFFWDCQPYATS